MYPNPDSLIEYPLSRVVTCPNTSVRIEYCQMVNNIGQGAAVPVSSLSNSAVSV